jgi:hypothetical protein
MYKLSYNNAEINLDSSTGLNSNGSHYPQFCSNTPLRNNYIHGGSEIITAVIVNG